MWEFLARGDTSAVKASLTDLFLGLDEGISFVVNGPIGGGCTIFQTHSWTVLTGLRAELPRQSREDCRIARQVALKWPLGCFDASAVRNMFAATNSVSLEQLIISQASGRRFAQTLSGRRQTEIWRTPSSKAAGKLSRFSLLFSKRHKNYGRNLRSKWPALSEISEASLRNSEFHFTPVQDVPGARSRLNLLRIDGHL
jgi:hypothetical protein